MNSINPFGNAYEAVSGQTASGRELTKTERTLSAIFMAVPFVKVGKAAGAVGDGAIDVNRLNHIFGKSEHALEGLVTKYGSQVNAFKAVEDAANRALKNGTLTPGADGVLPRIGSIINVGGMDVRLIGGRILDGKVILSSFSRRGL